MNTEKLDAITSEAAVVANLVMDVATATAEVKRIGKHPFTINPRNGIPVSLADYLDKPLAIKKDLTLTEFESFVSYITAFKEEGTVIFGSYKLKESPILSAVLDYHRGPAEPESCGHRVSLALTHSQALAAWVEQEKKPMDQMQFVEFLEERSREIVTPSGAEILEIARDLHVVHGGECRSVLRQGHDLQIHFQKTEKVQTAGEVTIPAKFEVQIPAFDGMPSVISTVVRLRVRVREGAVSFSYVIENLRVHCQDAFLEVAQQAGQSAAVPVFV